ncbi:MAG: 16S rRNA (cytidine(1402)-2'-O)-methyltransferase [Desulfobacterales bacterium]|jgi:16S rRNA (cytidine1402-2'-O)-methyltransferase
MRSNSPTDKGAEAKGTLFVLATPIGNLRDITLRALDVLLSVDFIAAEDTRHTGRLLKGRNPKGRFISYHEHNEDKRTPLLLEKLEAGFSVAVVSNAGTPSISDPGYRLVESAAARNIPVSPVPGASAAIAALSVSGLPTDSFVFIGFLPRKQGRRTDQLTSLRDMPRTMIFYESPKRISRLLDDLLAVMGDRSAVLGREMTKLHEEFLRGRLSELIALLEDRRDIKGECTLVVSGSPPDTAEATTGLYEKLTNRLKQKKVTLSEVVREVVRETGLPRKIVYGAALEIKRNLDQGDKTGDSA